MNNIQSMTPKINYENIWLPITIYNSNDINYFTKKDAYFMKKLDICFFIAEIDFYTNNYETNEIIIDMPEIDYDFIPCENTILSTKTYNNEKYDSIVRIKLFPKKLILYSFPFQSNTHYEFNIQLFMRLKDITKI